MGDECYKKGDVKQAIQFYQGSIDVTPKMAAEIIIVFFKIIEM